MLDLIAKLRGGAIQDWVAVFGVIIAIITVINNIDAFQVPQAIPSPHLAWLSGNPKPKKDFGYGKEAGPRSITVTSAIQNAGLENKQPSSGSWNYSDVMRELDRQSRKKMVEIQVGDQMYTIPNPDREGANQLQFLLADQMYDSIRSSDTDICDIAENLGFKADNIKNVKDHVFYNEHELDQYVSLGDES